MSEAYILNKVQTPNGLWPVYRTIATGVRTNEALSEATGLDDSSVKELVGGLRLLRMIKTTEYEHSVVPTAWDTGDDRRDFQLTALEHLTAEAQGEWGKQAVVQLNYQYLIEQNCQQFENNQEALYNNIDTWLERETDYRPKNGDSLYSHNKHKFGNWTRLAHFLGLLHKVAGREYVVYPEPELVLATIEAASTDSRYKNPDIDVGLFEYQNWMHETVLRVGEADDERIPAVLSRMLAVLARNGHIELIEYGDAGNVTLTNVPKSESRNIHKAANSIKIT